MMVPVLTDLRLSAGSQTVLRIAQAMAREHMHASYGSAHLLKALLHKDVGLEPLLWQQDLDVYYVDDWAETRMEGCRKGAAPKENVRGDDAVMAVLEEADTVRVLQNEEEVGPMQMLIALCRSEEHTSELQSQ